VREAIYGIGIVLQFAGVVVALRGLGELSSELFQRGSKLPHQVALRWVASQLGRQPPAQVVRARGAGEYGYAGRARGLTTKPRPTENATLGEWNAYWESQFEAVRTQLGWLKSDLKEGHAELRGSINDGSRALAAAERKNAEYVRTVVAGDGGKGLTRTWWGLAITGCGILLAGPTGGPW
jgi:hypothetical protein